MDQYIGEVRMFGGNFAPVGWAFCNGQEIPISENETLFALIGTRFGGDGETTFALPNLQGRIPIGQGGSTTGTPYQLGAAGGTETVTLTTPALPIHSHSASAQSVEGSTTDPADQEWAKGVRQYSSQAPNATMNNENIISSGGNQPHDNMMPSLTVSYIISLYGVFPMQA